MPLGLVVYYIRSNPTNRKWKGMPKMKKYLFTILTVLLLFCLVSCGSSKDFMPDYESAVGVILVNAEQELPEQEKIYADFENNIYTFDLDAACVYFFYANADEAYAGDMNFTSMAFGANLDNGTVGAAGTIAYLPNEKSQNTVEGYYLYHDETGVYFSTETYFDKTEITDGCTMVGIDYSCEATFNIRQPVTSFSVIYNKNSTNTSKTDYTPDEVIDYQTFDLESDISSVTVICYDADNQELSSETVTQENPNAIICFDNGGQFLGSKLLHFNWQE